jgi:hypothetical protein
MKTSSARSLAADFESKMLEKEIQLVIEIDDLLARALEGDRSAVGAIAVGLGPLLLEEAECVLGRDYAHEASDVRQEFYVSLLEGVHVRPAYGRAISWMCGVVRAIARKYRAERDWDWDIDDEPYEEI